MIDFIELEGNNAGKTYNGLYDKANEVGYTHWLPGAQSTHICYSHKICFICDSKNVTIEMDDNEVFKLINPQYNILDLNKITPVSSNGKQSINLIPYIHGVNQYIYMIYFVARSESIGEFAEYITIKASNETKYVRIGGDFYCEDERLYINLSNMGVEIPQGIQQAFYESYIKEYYHDNILLNRKFKELISNYWDIVANKGSYKSLQNSLKWFEWGDKLCLKELWSHQDPENQKMYDIRDLKSIMDEKYKDTFNNTIKSTYISILCNAGKLKIEGDSLNIEPIIFDKSLEELSLKLSLLGNFFETYFTPIHVDLIHSLVAIPVLSKDTITLKSGGLKYDLNNFVFNTFDCIITNQDNLHIDNVVCYVDNNTLFKADSETNYGVTPVGVEDSVNISNNDDLKTFYSQWRHERGCIVEFKCDFKENPSLDGQSYIEIKRKGEYNKSTYLMGVDHPVSNKRITFKIFFPNPGDYDMVLVFKSTKTYYKKISFKILPIPTPTLELYKVANNGTALPNDFYFKSSGNSYIVNNNQTQFIYNLGSYINRIIDDSPYYEIPVLKDNQYLYIKPSHPFNENEEDIQWILKNKCGRSVELKGARAAVITAPTWEGQLDKGYYDVIMRYKMNGVVKEIKYNNAFKKE